ncbi:MAG: protein kinase, partial [Planctomycetaceae bacterium]|nr:protein kinase [Planctomycetaceae bacterium]
MTDDDPEKTVGPGSSRPDPSETLPGQGPRSADDSGEITASGAGSAEIDEALLRTSPDGKHPDAAAPDAQEIPGPEDTCPPDFDPEGSVRLTGSGVSAAPVLPSSFGPYRIISQLGEGSMGTVYLARDRDLDRQVALKVPKFSSAEDSDVIGRFYREARAAATLRNPNICPVYNVGEINGIHYLAMAYIHGRPLQDFINPEKPRPQRQVVSIVRKLTGALQEAHTLGIVHRDLKPANIMIDERQEPMIMDFGLARHLILNDADFSSQGDLIGSPAYMSPEQIDSELGNVGPQSDIYSTGVMLYQLLTGRLPFQDRTVNKVLVRILTEDPPELSQLRPDIDPDLAAICLKMMARLPRERYQSMREVRQALRDWVIRNRAQQQPDESARPGSSAPANSGRTSSSSPAVPSPEDTVYDLGVPAPKGTADGTSPGTDSGSDSGAASGNGADSADTCPSGFESPEATQSGTSQEGRADSTATDLKGTPEDSASGSHPGSRTAVLEGPISDSAPAARSGYVGSSSGSRDGSSSGSRSGAGGAASSSGAEDDASATFAEHLDSSASSHSGPLAPVPAAPLPEFAEEGDALEIPHGRVQLQLVQDGRVIDGRSFDIPAGSVGWLELKMAVERDSVAGRNRRKSMQHRLASMVLKLGGSLHIAFDGAAASQTREISHEAELPSREFSISRVKLQKISRSAQAALSEICRLDTLEEADLHGTRLSAEQTADLASLPLLRSLNLAGRHVTDETLALLSSATSLQSLFLWKCRATGQGIASLSSLSQLRELGIESRDLTDDGLAGLEQLTLLETLSLSSRRVTDKGLFFLASLPKLKSLGLGQTPIRGDGLLSLSEATELKQMWLHRTHLDNAGLRSLSVCPQLEALDLGATRVDDAGLATLTSLARLRTLLLYQTRTGDRQLDQLTDLPELEVLNLNETRITEQSLSVLGRMRRLQFLHVANTAITAPGLHRLRRDLPGCRIKGGGPPVATSIDSAPDSLFGELEDIDAYGELRETVEWILQQGGKMEISAGGEPRTLVTGDILPDVDLEVISVVL